MGLRHLARSWNSLAADDPLWAILTWPDKTGRRWDLDEFLATGRDEIDGVMAAMTSFAPTLGRRRALDFGCGVGRLSQALATRFDEVHGVDIAARMIDEARRINRHPEICAFHRNQTADLGRFTDGSFDLIYSSLTLQHMPPRLMRSYITEFCRLLEPNGIAVFQIAAALVRPPHPNPLLHLAGRTRAQLGRWWRTRVWRQPSMDMFGIAPDEVRGVVTRAGGAVVNVEGDSLAGSEWTSHRYYVRRAGPG